jgi:AraC family transcriptional regulator, transcriptional activator of pobA
MVYLSSCMTTHLSIKDKSDNSRFLKVSAFRKDTRKTEPHKHKSYFELVYLSSGHGYHTIDNRRFEVRVPVLFFIRHEQVHYWELDAGTEPDGYVLILKKAFFEQSMDGELKKLLAMVSRFSCAYLDEHLTIQQLLELLVRENATESEHSFAITEGLLKALFVKIVQAARPVAERNHRQADLYQAFTDLLISGRPIKNNVAHYAALLNTTPQNLNAVCRKAVDRPAAGVLAESIIDEAKRLLAYTDNTIAEVSFALSFKDPSHFVKYFKRHTAFTPQVFRGMQQ